MIEKAPEAIATAASDRIRVHNGRIRIRRRNRVAINRVSENPVAVRRRVVGEME